MPHHSIFCPACSATRSIFIADAMGRSVDPGCLGCTGTYELAQLPEMVYTVRIQLDGHYPGEWCRCLAAVFKTR